MTSISPGETGKHKSPFFSFLPLLHHAPWYYILIILLVAQRLGCWLIIRGGFSSLERKAHTNERLQEGTMESFGSPRPVKAYHELLQGETGNSTVSEDDRILVDCSVAGRHPKTGTFFRGFVANPPSGQVPSARPPRGQWWHDPVFVVWEWKSWPARLAVNWVILNFSTKYQTARRIMIGIPRWSESPQ
jgi:hypothetical protein